MLKSALLGIVVSLGVPNVYAGVFEDGMAAFEAHNYQEALTLWRSLAEQGDVNAQIELGDMYANGLGVKRDTAEAIIWFNKAVAQGSAEAEFRLGEVYRKGQGIPVDYEQAIAWYRKAARQGHAGAQYSLGVSYFKGEGVATDYLTAYAWMVLAEKQGHKSSSIYRDLIESVLTPDELKKAKALAVQ